ncbi:hypothetical protein PCANC_22138 [Puccinia coronata f. sp. avenae]|uniref:Uncharacterized protein n=1 Tax=Puccinia coronata f. sp. avenae TaxID=200324 RepID=A0A2N5UF28_9BASI|nr:hypothetical protein PCANC_22138 [Puccinia coronata f. sp. avenae]PLW36351.1 hypothetical protein PCASD_18657 [Puccinia coronata f. sp. avenae]
MQELNPSHNTRPQKNSESPLVPMTGTLGCLPPTTGQGPSQVKRQRGGLIRCGGLRLRFDPHSSRATSTSAVSSSPTPYS